MARRAAYSPKAHVTLDRNPLINVTNEARRGGETHGGKAARRCHASRVRHKPIHPTTQMQHHKLRLIACIKRFLANDPTRPSKCQTSTPRQRSTQKPNCQPVSKRSTLVGQGVIQDGSRSRNNHSVQRSALSIDTFRALALLRRICEKSMILEEPEIPETPEDIQWRLEQAASVAYITPPSSPQDR